MTYSALKEFTINFYPYLPAGHPHCGDSKEGQREGHGFANAWIQDPEVFPESPEDLALRSAPLLTFSSKLLLCPDREEQSVIWWVLHRLARAQTRRGSKGRTTFLGALLPEAPWWGRAGRTSP